MRIATIVTALLLQTAVLTAQASPREPATGAGYIPAPAAQSAGRTAVLKQLRKLGKDELAFERLENASNTGNIRSTYTFEAKVLLDTPTFFSLELHSRREIEGRSGYGWWTPMLFEMKSGREYDISRLYRVRDASGEALVAPLRGLIARRLVTDETTPARRKEVMEWIDADLARDRPDLFVAEDGIWAWPKVGGGGQWFGKAVVTWAELRPYLDTAEAKRIGWVAP